jgi:ElaB/YqjD/DUF883 family membrane-anchored ribosome-binding protein
LIRGRGHSHFVEHLGGLRPRAGRAARYGSAALTRVTEETEQRPLLAIAVALGVGILIGMAARGRT